MSTRLLLEGPDLEELLERIKEEHGAAARIVSAERVRTGGVAGFFSRQKFEIAVDVFDADEPLPPETERPVADRPPEAARRGAQSETARHRTDSAERSRPVLDLSAPSDDVDGPAIGGLGALLERAEQVERRFEERDRRPAPGDSGEGRPAMTAMRFAEILADRATPPAPPRPTSAPKVDPPAPIRRAVSGPAPVASPRPAPRPEPAPKAAEPPQAEPPQAEPPPAETPPAEGAEAADVTQVIDLTPKAPPEPAPTAAVEAEDDDEPTEEKAVTAGTAPATENDEPAVDAVPPTTVTSTAPTGAVTPPAPAVPEAPPEQAPPAPTDKAPADKPPPEPEPEKTPTPEPEDAEKAEKAEKTKNDADGDAEPPAETPKAVHRHQSAERPRLPARFQRSAAPPPRPEPAGYDHPAVQLVRMGVPVHIAARAVGPDPWSAVARAVAGLPYPPALPSRPGEILVIVGETEAALVVAGQVAAQSVGVDLTDTLVAGSIAGTGLARSHRISGPEEAARRRDELHASAAPRIVVVEAGDGIHDGATTAATITALHPTQVWACTDATRKNADTARFLAPMERVDALAVHGAGATVEPGSVLHFGLPVVMLDGRPATARRWTALLCEHLAGATAPGEAEQHVEPPLEPVPVTSAHRGAHESPDDASDDGARPRTVRTVRTALTVLTSVSRPSHRNHDEAVEAVEVAAGQHRPPGAHRLTAVRGAGEDGDDVGLALFGPVENAGTEPFDWFGHGGERE